MRNVLLSISAASVAFASLLLPSTASVVIPSMSPASSDEFANSVGVDTHFNYPGTPYTDRFPIVANDLIALGVRHIRDGGPGYSRPQTLSFLGQRGVMHSLSFPIDTTAQQIIGTLNANAPYVDLVEPQNELDVRSRDHPNWATEWRDEQRLLYATVRSDPKNFAIKVGGAAVGHYVNAAELGSLDQYEDVGTMHQYPCDLNPGDTQANVSLPSAMRFQRQVNVSKPIWTTEIGYADDLPDGRCALPDSVIAKYDPRTIAERWLSGQRRTYFYQFADMGAVHGYDAMGLVNTNGDPKPQYKALQSMLRLVTDLGATVRPNPLGYSVTGETDNVAQLLLQKRDKTYLLLLWLEVPSWDSRSKTPIRVEPQKVTISLSSAPQSVTRYAYATDWTLQKFPMRAAKAIETTVSDSISFVEIR
jgi:hypothetical protein